MGIRLAAVAALALSCGSSQHGSTPEAQPKVITYGPLGAKVDAKKPNQAVILGTDDKNGSTVIPLPEGNAKATVDALYVQMGGAGPAVGGITPVKLTTGPNPDQAVSVGLFEEFNGGTGPQWRAGVWVAAIVAAQILGKDLTDFTFSASSGGYIDGASASGLMTGGFLAAMTGAKIDPTVTMTGIINPDGTIGPVGGIPEKFLGSIEKGKKKLGYPIGMRMAKSEATGDDVDLVELAKKHGAEAIEISDVHEAYKLLTGKELPETVAVNEKDMALDAGTTAALDEKYKAWEARLAKEWSPIVQLESAGKLPPLLVQLRDLTKTSSDLAESLHKKGQLSAAYQRMLYAWTYATATNSTYDILDKIKKGDLNGAIASVNTLSTLGANQLAVFQKIGTMRPKTLGGHLQMMAAFRTALRSYTYRVLAERMALQTTIYLQGLSGLTAAQLGAKGKADEIAGQVAPALLYLGRTSAEITLALEQMDFEKEESVMYMCSLPNVKRMATSFSSAAAAGVSYFDTMVIDEVSKAYGITQDDARNRFSIGEPDYLVAYMMSKLNESENMPKELKTAWGEKSLAWGLMSLAGSELAYYDSAELIAKYYSLGVHADPNGQVDKIMFESAFTNMLASAERNARANARAARIAAGAIPVQAKLSYQVAITERDGSLTEKVDALGEFWASSAFSQTAIMLARN
jgi:uncharacterized protein